MNQNSNSAAAGQANIRSDAAQRLLRAGYHRILPVIPPNAPMRVGTDQKTLDARGKIPGVCKRGLWHPLPGWQNFSLNPQNVPNWDAAGANVGLAMGENFAALDVDVTDPKMAFLMREFLRDEGIDAPVRLGRAPKFLLPFQVKGKRPCKTRSHRMELNGDPQLVEVLGTGRQAVIWGRHPGGFDYTWDRDIVALRACNLPEIEPADLHNLAQRMAGVLLDNGCVPAKGARIGVVGGSAHSSKEGALARNPEALCEAFRLLPNDYGRAEWIRLGQALKAGVGKDHEADGLAAWEEWSATGEAHTNPQTPAKEWGTMTPDGSIGAGTVIWELDHRGVDLHEDLRSRLMKKAGKDDFEVIELDETQWAKQEAARAANWDQTLPDFDKLGGEQGDADFAVIFAPNDDGTEDGNGQNSVKFDPLTDTPGLVGSIMRWTYGTSIRDETAPGIVAGLAAVSIAIGTAFKFEPGDTEYGNVGVNLVMPTGGGKGEVSRTLRLTTAIVGVDHLYQNFRSQPAMHNAFLEVQSRFMDARILLLSDELGRHLQSLRKGGDTNKSDVQTQIVEAFQDYVIPAQPLAQNPRPKIHPAYLVPIGLTQPTVLAGGLPDDALADGSVTRPLWFFGEFRPKRTPSGPVRGVLPQNIQDALAWLYRQFQDMRNAADITGLEDYPEITLRVEAAAQAVLAAFDAECEAKALNAAAESDGATVAIMSRAFQNTRRTALVIAAGEAAEAGGATLDLTDVNNPTIPLTEAAANAAVGLVRRSSEGLARYAREHIGVSLEAQIEKRVLRVMGAALKKGQPALKHKVLVDRCRNSDDSGRTKVKGLQVRRAIEDLLDRGWLDEGNLEKAKAYKLSPRGREELSRLD